MMPKAKAAEAVQPLLLIPKPHGHVPPLGRRPNVRHGQHVRVPVESALGAHRVRGRRINLRMPLKVPSVSVKDRKAQLLPEPYDQFRRLPILYVR